MKNIKPFLFFILSIISTADILFSRGGGGCVEKGSLIDTVRGKIKIEDIKKGDIVITNQKKLSEVQSVYGTESKDIIEIKACEKTIRSTPDHPFMISAGIFKEALFLKKGD
ncbi:MAG TPA: Hint domain-containing protein, partial [Elusimicrobiales bacterium]|nr:Hint domain-containing protein [Elusimicrobiales bacterium]